VLHRLAYLINTNRIQPLAHH